MSSFRALMDAFAENPLVETDVSSTQLGFGDVFSATFVGLRREVAYLKDGVTPYEAKIAIFKVHHMSSREDSAILGREVEVRYQWDHNFREAMEKLNPEEGDTVYLRIGELKPNSSVYRYWTPIRKEPAS